MGAARSIACAEAAALMNSLCRLVESLHRLDALLPKLLDIEFIQEVSMDVVFDCACATMFVAIVGMVLGCDQLGVHK
jgi:hypothetical protein